MDVPGLSIFQSSDLKINGTYQRAEEDEFIADSKKREAELKDLFEAAFEDDDSDASSLVSSQFSVNQSDEEMKNHPVSNYNFAPVTDFQQMPLFHQKKVLEPIAEKFDESNDSILMPGSTSRNISNNKVETDSSLQHYKHCFKNRPTLGRDVEMNLMDSYKKAESGGYDELKILYEVRMREVERLRLDVQVEKEAKEEAIHQLALCQAENKQILSESSEYQEFLTKSKDRISELEESIIAMKSEILELEKARGKDKEEVEISHQQVICLEQKIAAMERCDPAVSRAKQMDIFIENLNSKHKKELSILQNKLESFESRFEKKEGECRALENKLDEVERKRAALVLEKCDGAARQENALQTLLKQANEEKLNLNRQIISLQSECAGLKSELEQYESVAKLRLCLGSSSDESPEVGRIGLPIARTRSTSSLAKSSVNPHQQDLISNLRDELHRALLAKAAKRHEINKLQEHVRSKEIQIQEMKERERVYLSQADSLKADISKIVGQLNEHKDNKEPASEELKVEIERLSHTNREQLRTIESLRSDIDRLSEELKSEYSLKVKQGEDFIGLHENELTRLRAKTDELLRSKDLEWRGKLDLVIRECDEIKQLYMELRSSKGQINDELDVQKQQLSLLNREKDQILAALKEKESLIDKLKEENIKYKLEKEMNMCGQESVPDRNNVLILESEVERLRRELVELPKRQTEELVGLKNELEAAKFRLIELDKRLRNEFQNEISSIIAERNFLKELVKQKEESLSNLRVGSIAKQDMEVGTDSAEVDEVSRLKREILRISQLNNEQNSDELYRKTFGKEMAELEKRLIAEHKAELVTTEERIKSTVVSYYTEQINEIKKQFESELTNIIANEEKKINELAHLLTQKDNEIRQMKSNDSSEKLVALQKKMDEDRLKVSETIKRWSTQVETLKDKIAEDENKIKYLNQSLKNERKDAQKYKAKLDNAKKRIEQEKLENMIKIKNHIQDLISTVDLGEKKMNEQINMIEMEFSEKEKELKRQYELNQSNKLN